MLRRLVSYFTCVLIFLGHSDFGHYLCQADFKTNRLSF